MALFFVISGFIIYRISPDRPFNPGDYAAKRLGRIVPLYWLTTLLVFVAALAAPSLFKTTTATVPHLLKSLFFIPHPDPATADEWRPIHKVGWTLFYELIFYTTFGAFFWVRSRMRRGLYVLSVITIAMVVGHLTFDPYTPSHFLEFAHLLPFALGLTIGLVSDGVTERLAAVRYPLLAISHLVAALYFWGRVSGVVQIDLDAIVAAFCLLAWVASDLARATPVWKPLVAVGDASYSMYLLHLFVVALVWKLAAVLHAPILREAAGVAGSAALTILVSILSFRFFERPIMDAIARRDVGTQTAGASVRQTP